MKDSRVHFLWNERNLHAKFRTGVSVHSHTLYSRESLDFIGRATANTPWLSGAIRKQQEKYRALKGCDVNLKRAWWTPPLSPLHAWKLEKSQIENGLDREALVSLTDHDNIDAGLNLSWLEETRECPISVEWTVPFRETFFHFGIHNLPAQEATSIMRDLAAFTANPVETEISPLRSNCLHSKPGDADRSEPSSVGRESHRRCDARAMRRLAVVAIRAVRSCPGAERIAALVRESGGRATGARAVSAGDFRGRSPRA